MKRYIKILCIIVVALLILNVSYLPATALSNIKAHVENLTIAGVNLNVYVQDPRTNDTVSASKKYPLYVYLHGEDELARIGELISSPGTKDFWPSSITPNFDIPIYVAAPKFVGTTVDWTTTEQIAQTVEMIKSIKAKYSIDPQRIFIGGYSAGANGALYTAIANPKIDDVSLAGIIAARLTKVPSRSLVSPISNIPLWIIQGQSDDFSAIVQEFTKGINARLNDVTSTYSSLGNQVEDLMMDDGIITWMLAKPTRFASYDSLPGLTKDIGTATLATRSMKYYVQMPRVKDFQGFNVGTKYPLIIDMHGYGGESNIDNLISGAWGSYGMEHFRNNSELPFIMALPRNPTGGSWGNSADLIIKMIENLTSKYPIDENRIYLTGFSMGGYGSWDVAMKYPNVFAAIAPCSGATKTFDELYKMGNIPVLAVHGYLDNVTSYPNQEYAVQRMIRLNKKSGMITLKLGHALVRDMRSEGVMNWLLKQNKQNHLPLAIPSDYKLPNSPEVNPLEPGVTKVIGKTVPYSTVILRKNNQILLKGLSNNVGDFILTLSNSTVDGQVFNLSTMGMYGVEGQTAIVNVAPKPTPTPTPTLAPTPAPTPTPAPSPTKISLNRTSVAIYVGKKFTLVITVSPLSASAKVSWRSSNKSVATVVGGKLFGLKVGTTVVTAKTTNGKTAQCTVSIKPVKVTSVKLAKKAYSLKVGKKLKLISLISPTNATLKSVTWRSSNKLIAKIDSTGKVTGMKTGKVTISVTTKDGNKRAKSTITVS